MPTSTGMACMILSHDSEYIAPHLTPGEILGVSDALGREAGQIEASARNKTQMLDLNHPTKVWIATLRNFVGEICANIICFCPHF